MRIIAGLLALSFVGIGCGKKEEPPKPLATVNVGHAVQREVLQWDEYPGVLASPQFANVSAQVSGILERAPFDEGAVVQKGDVLFIIDERPFVAEMKSKEADIARAEAQLAQAEATYQRYKPLKQSRAISAQDFDAAVAAMRTAKASVGVAMAARDVAKLSLDWTRVTAPISGRVGRKLVTEGNLIAGGLGQATTLTTITSIDPLYAYASVPERTFLQNREFSRSKTNEIAKRSTPCLIQLENSSGVRREGVVDFLDNKIDANTGTVEMRCRIPNADGALLPGLYARLRIPAGEAYRAILVPEGSIGADQTSRFILTVNKDNVIERKTLELGARFGSFRAVKSGVTLEDRIVTAGVQQARPGAKVEVKETPIATKALDAFDPPPGLGMSTTGASSLAVAVTSNAPNASETAR